LDDPTAIRAFQSSIVLRRSLRHSLELGESIFIRIVPNKKIFCYGIGANVWQFLIPSQNRDLGNFYVIVPQNRQDVDNSTRVEQGNKLVEAQTGREGNRGRSRM
jgi:hypothetical protein